MFSLVPVLAQVAVLNVADRTEARVVDTGQKNAAGYRTSIQGDTRPLVVLGLAWRKGALSLQYTPVLTLAPIDRTPRFLTVVHGVGLSGGYRYRRTAISVGEYVSFGERDLRQEALAAAQPVAPPQAEPVGAQNSGKDTNGQGDTNGNGSTGANGTTGNGSSGNGTTGIGNNPGSASAGPQVRAADGRYSFAALTTSLGVTHQLSARMRFSLVASYLYAGGQGERARVVYPVTKSPGALVSLSDALDRRNAISTSLSLTYISASQTDVWLSTLSEGWTYVLGPKTSSSLSAGVAATRLSTDAGLVQYSIFPALTASISHGLAFRRDGLTFGASAASSPVLDPVKQVVDPRVNLGLSAGYSRQRFFSSLSGSSVLSLNGPHSEGSFSSFGTALTAGYRVADPISVDGGVRAAWQRYEGVVLFGPALSAFVGISLAADVPLIGHAGRR